MHQVYVNIGGRSYRLACNPGEESHLTSLAGFVDEKIEEMRKSFGEIGDQRIVVMAALSLADELFEAKRKVDNHASETAQALDAEKSARANAESHAESLIAVIDEMAERVETMSRSLNAPEE